MIYSILSILAVLGYGWVCYFWVINFAIPMAKEITNMGDIIWWWKYPTVEEQKKALNAQQLEIAKQTEEILQKFKLKGGDIDNRHL